MRTLLTIMAVGTVGILSAPYVFAGDVEPMGPAEQPAAVQQDCGNTIGEARVWCFGQNHSQPA